MIVSSGMGKKILAFLYHFFVWFLFPTIFSFPLLMNQSEIGYVFKKLLFPEVLAPFIEDLIGNSIIRFLIFNYVVGLFCTLTLVLLFKFTVKNNKIRFVILVILVILSWLTWNPRDHYW